MQKLTPGANKANAILIRIVLFLIGGIAIITGMCLFSGDMWMLTPRAEQYRPATGDLVDVFAQTVRRYNVAAVACASNPSLLAHHIASDDLAGCELQLGYLLSLNRNLPPHECGFQ